MTWISLRRAVPGFAMVALVACAVEDQGGAFLPSGAPPASGAAADSGAPSADAGPSGATADAAMPQPSRDGGGNGGERTDGATGAADGALPAAAHYAGVNLSGAEFGDAIPGQNGADYQFPNHGEVDYYVGKGMGIFRLPFLWERLQTSLDGDLDQGELALIDDVVTYATGKGAAVLLDVHNYGRWQDKVVGDAVPSAAFADLWSKLAAHYKSNPKVFFGLMNEPHDEPASTWLGAANAAIAAIRSAGATNLVTVPGTDWTGAWTWTDGDNGTVMAGVVDPGNNFVYEVHQYLDTDSSGTHDTCVSNTVGSERLKSFTDWAKAHGKRALLGEFGGGRNTTCLDALDDMLTYMDANKDVWFAWTYWAGGPWWGDYMFALDPSNGQDRPQMGVLSKHF